jgi:hypothetical protein
VLTPCEWEVAGSREREVANPFEVLLWDEEVVCDDNGL